MRKTLLTALMVLLAASSMLAGTQATNASTVSPTLQLSGTIVSAVKLTLSVGTGGAGSPHCAVTFNSPTVDPNYSMSFGTMDALGISAGSCALYQPTTPGTTPAVYWSDYNLTPIFASQTASTGTITANVTTNFAANTGAAVMYNTANTSAVPASAAAFSNLTVGSATTIVNNAANATAVTRYIGIGLTPTNGAAVVTGAQTATVTFTLTVP